MNRTKKNIVYNIIANVGLKVVKVAQNLLLVPIFLSVWGAAYYGEWLTLCIIPSVFAFSDLGFGTAASNSFVLRYSKGDYKGASNIFKTALYVITFIIIICLVVFALLLAFFYKTEVSSNVLIPAEEAITAVTFLLASRLLGFYFQLFESFYRAERKAALSTYLQTANEVIIIMVSVAVLLLGHGIVAFAFVQLIAMLVFTILYAIIALHIIKNKPYHGSFVFKEVQEMIKKGVGFMMTPIWQASYIQGTTLVVRVLFGAEVVAMFNTVRTVAHSITQLYSILNNSVFPEIQYHFGVGNYETAQRIYIRSFRLALFIGIGGFIALSLFGKDIYTWWTKNTIEVPSLLWIVFMLSILLNSIWWTSSCIYRAVNKPYKLGAYGIISAILSVSCAYILGQIFGIVGSAIGYVAMDLFMLLLVVPAACKLLNINILKLIK